MKIYKDDVNKAVGVSFKMHMKTLCDNPKTYKDNASYEEFWQIIERDAIQMIKSSGNVMRSLTEKPDEGQTKIDDYVEDTDK